MNLLEAKIMKLSKRELLVTSLVILACLFLFYVFPAKGIAQNLTRSLFFFLVIPFLYIKFILKKGLDDFGFNLKNKKTGLNWGIGMLVFSLLFFYLFFRYTALPANYNLPNYLVSSFWYFLIHELILVNIIFFLQEFFFHGFTLSTFSKKLGFLSILVPVILYGGVLLLAGKLNWQNMPMVITSITGSVVSYRTRSFLFAYLAGIIFLVLVDAYVIYLIK